MRYRPSVSTAGRATRRVVLERFGTAGRSLVIGAVTGGVGACVERDVESVQIEANGSRSPTPERGYRPLEIAHWWTAPGEAAAVRALLDGFTERYPTVEIYPVGVGGGAGTALRNAVRHRIVDGNPPSTFQCWGGAELKMYIDAVTLHPISDLWGDGMRTYIRPEATEAVRHQGEFIAVPITVHRVNTLWYNVPLVERVGIDPTTIDTPERLTDALATVEADTNATGLAICNSSWSQLQTFEHLLLAEGGIETYHAVLQGNPGSVADTIRRAIAHLAAYRTYGNLSTTWVEAGRQVEHGSAAFVQQGDWMVGLFHEEGAIYGEDWDVIPFPGTDGFYVYTVDCFVFPKHNPSPNSTAAFLEYVGTVDAQRRFNAKKGSLPARSKVSVANEGPYERMRRSDFERISITVPSIAHGMAVRTDRRRRVTAVIEDGDPFDDHTALANRLIDALSE